MKTEDVNVVNYKGYKIRIIQDEFYDSPDNWGDEQRFLVYDHRDFYVKRKGFNPDDIFEVFSEGKKLYDGFFIFPVYAYIHSGVALQLKRWFNYVPQGHNEFDVSFKGFALIKKEKGTYTSEKAYQAAEGLLNVWNDCLSGNVYGFIAEDNEENEIDSCWGFYGDPEKSGLIEDAKSNIDFEIKNRLEKRILKVKTFIKNNVPLENRTQLISML
jgi:hypothetical protein